MFIREIDQLLKRHDPRWRIGIFVVFLIACVQSIAVVVRPLPINALIAGAKPDTWWGGIEAVLTRDIDRIWLYVGLIFAIEVVVLIFFMLSEYRTSALSERIIRSIRGSIALNLHKRGAFHPAILRLFSLGFSCLNLTYPYLDLLGGINNQVYASALFFNPLAQGGNFRRHVSNALAVLLDRLICQSLLSVILFIYTQSFFNPFR